MQQVLLGKSAFFTCRRVWYPQMLRCTDATRAQTVADTQTHLNKLVSTDNSAPRSVPRTAMWRNVT